MTNAQNDGEGGGDAAPTPTLAPTPALDFNAIRRVLRCRREHKRHREEYDDFITWKQTQTEVCTDDRALWVLQEEADE